MYCIRKLFFAFVYRGIINDIYNRLKYFEQNRKLWNKKGDYIAFDKTELKKNLNKTSFHKIVAAVVDDSNKKERIRIKNRMTNRTPRSGTHTDAPCPHTHKDCLG